MIYSIANVLCSTEDPGVSGANAKHSALLFSLLIRIVLLSQKQLLCGFFSLEAKVYFSRITYMMYASSETSLGFLSCQVIDSC